MLRIRLNKIIKCLFIKSFPTFNTSFNMLSMPGALFAFSLHLYFQYIYFTYTESGVDPIEEFSKAETQSYLGVPFMSEI